MQRLKEGPLLAVLPEGSEVWLDGGHNPAAGAMLAQTFAEMNDRDSRDLVMIMGMLANKDAEGYLRAFADLVSEVRMITIPEEPGSAAAEDLAAAATSVGLSAQTAPDLVSGVQDLALKAAPSPLRLLICGSLYLAGQVLRDHR